MDILALPYLLPGFVLAASGTLRGVCKSFPHEADADEPAAAQG